MNGLRAKDKREALKHESFNDHIVCLNETNYTENQKVNLISDGLGVNAEIKAMNDYTFDKSGNRIKCSDRADKLSELNYKCKTTKLSGYGTCIAFKDNKTTTIIGKDDLFEIVVVKVKLPTVCGLVVCVYRSPSMKNTEDNNNFFQSVENFIRQNDGFKVDFVLYIGDDNIHNTSTESSLWKRREEFITNCRMNDLLFNQPTRKGKQPDSCYARFNFAKIRMQALAFGKIHPRMDHSGIRIRIGFEGIVPRIPIYDKIVFRRCRKLSDAEIDNLLNNEFNKWYGQMFII